MWDRAPAWDGLITARWRQLPRTRIANRNQYSELFTLRSALPLRSPGIESQPLQISQLVLFLCFVEFPDHLQALEATDGVG